MLLISVIVPTYNRKSDLACCLNALENQGLSKVDYEVIVVDDGSNDGTSAFLKDFQSNTLLQFSFYIQHNSGPALARNLGIKHAKAELIAFTDDDCVPQEQWLKDLICAFPKDKSCAAIGGIVKRKNNSIISQYIDEYIPYKHIENKGIVYILCTANAVFKKSVLTELKGFNPMFTWPGGEDSELSFRINSAGYHMLSINSAIVLHKHRDSFKGIFKTIYYYGKGFYYLKQNSFYNELKGYTKNNKSVSFSIIKSKIGFKKIIIYTLANIFKNLGFLKGYYSAKLLKQNCFKRKILRNE